MYSAPVGLAIVSSVDWDPVATIRDWIIENANDAKHELEGLLREHANEAREFLNTGKYPGVRHCADSREILGRYEALVGIARLIDYELPGEYQVMSE